MAHSLNPSPAGTGEAVSSQDQGAVLVLGGPTASVKSSLAVELARKLGGEIISADSMQIYRGLDIGTAKIRPEEMQGIPHYLLNIREAGENYSVSDFSRDALQKIAEIFRRGHQPIICGGTGLYLKSLVDGIQYFGEGGQNERREKIRAKIREHGLHEAHRQLAHLDPLAAERISPQDEKRICRFFEVYEECGLTQTEVYRKSREAGPVYRYRCYALMPEREKLYQRINERCASMFDEGLEEEIKALIKDPEKLESQAFQAIGYKEILPWMRGEMSREEAIETLSRQTRRYAKRQYSLFRSRPDFIPINESDPNLALIEILEDFKAYAAE